MHTNLNYMEKIVTRTENIAKIKDHFHLKHLQAIYKALRFENNSLIASMIRCYTMNECEGSFYLTSKN